MEGEAESDLASASIGNCLTYWMPPIGNNLIGHGAHPQVRKKNKIIGLMEAICKLINTIINRKLSEKMTLHDNLHGFHKGWRISTSGVEINI